MHAISQTPQIGITINVIFAKILLAYTDRTCTRGIARWIITNLSDEIFAEISDYSELDCLSRLSSIHITIRPPSYRRRNYLISDIKNKGMQETIKYSIRAGGNENWGQIPGPGSLWDRFNQSKGLPPINGMPDATNIKITGGK